MWIQRLRLRPEQAYAILVGVVLLLILGQTSNQRWQADFWQHSACVHELSIHPWSPEHPHLPIDAPHEFYNPYSLLLGLISYVSGLSSVVLLSIMGMANFLFLAWALRRLCARLSNNSWNPFFTLLFTLVLWGYNPWMFSGFFHLAMLGETAQYPSCFCAALTFLSWSIYADYAGGRANQIRVLLLPLMLFIVLVSHPHTAVVLYIGLFTFWCGLPHHQRRYKTVVLGVIVVTATLAAFVWPYYSLSGLLGTSGSEHHAGNRWMYVRVLRMAFAALLFAPCVVGRIRRDTWDPIGLLFVALTCLYVVGYVSEKYAFGRTIVYILFCVHFCAAEWFASTVTHKASNHRSSRCYRIVEDAATAVILVFTVGFFAVGVYRYRPGRECTYAKYLFLPRYVALNDIVITDLNTAIVVPSFAGKVVGNRYITAFVNDYRDRQNAVSRFFAEEVSNAERRVILRKYNVQFILINEDEVYGEGVREKICRLGETVYSHIPLSLIDVRVASIHHDMPDAQ